jgi:hypothetical protein
MTLSEAANLKPGIKLVRPDKDIAIVLGPDDLFYYYGTQKPFTITGYHMRYDCWVAECEHPYENVHFHVGLSNFACKDCHQTVRPVKFVSMPPNLPKQYSTEVSPVRSI